MEASMEALEMKKKGDILQRSYVRANDNIQVYSLPMCREGKPSNFAAVDGLHPDWLCSQEVLHSHFAQLIT